MATYKESGVDIAAGEETIRRVKSKIRSTFTPGVLTDIGAFGGFFQLDLGKWKNPVLVSSVDGVGTKLKVAVMAGRHDTVGQDLVNHCVNDIAVCGATPLYFLDYFATGKLDPTTAAEVITGFTIACKENECALIGGETAEMPDMYQAGEYDLAGTIVGVVEKENILDGSDVSVGDVLIGLPSTGLHTNGYSLARKVLFSHFDVNDAPDELGGQTIGDVLLSIHKSYVKAIKLLTDTKIEGKRIVNAFSHITGGGIEGNTERVIPDGASLNIDWKAWKRPPIFDLIQSLGPVPEEDMRIAFNLGIGLIAIVPELNVETVCQIWRDAGEVPIVLGTVQ